MIISLKHGVWKEQKSLFEALGLNTGVQEILALTGGGGKTTLIRKLQQELTERGIFHGVSTTTHIQYEQNDTFLGEPSLNRFLDIYQKKGTVWMGEPISEEKIKAFPNTFYEEVIQTGAWLLIEADGAKHFPVKAPAEHEPVLLPETTIVCNVYGLDGIGKAIRESCFRIQKVTELLGKQEEELLEEDDLVYLACSEAAGRKLAGERPYHVILNKADDQERQAMAKRIGEKIKAHGITQIHITAGMNHVVSDGKA